MIFGRFERAGHRLAAITLTEGLFLAAALDETWSAGLWAEKSYIVINLLCALVETELRPRPTDRPPLARLRSPTFRPLCLWPFGRFKCFLQFEEATLWCLAHRWRYRVTQLHREAPKTSNLIENSLYQCFLLQRFPEKLQSLKSH